MAKLKYYWTGGTDPTRDSIQAVSELSNAPRGLQAVPIEQVRQLSQSNPTLRVLNLETGYALDKSLLAQPTIESSMVIGPNGQMMPATTAANYISPEQGLKAAGGGSYLTPQQSAQSFQTPPITSASIQAGIANLQPPPNMTPAQQTAWNNAVALIPSKTGGSITSSNLQGGGTSPDLSGVGKNNLDEAGAAVAGMAGFDKFVSDYTKAREVPKDPKIDSLESSIASLMGDSANRGADQAKADQEQEVQAKKEALTVVQGKMKQLEAEFNAYSLDQEGKPITLASIQGSVAAKRNAIAGEMLMLQAQASLLTGQYNDAVSAANRSVDLKYLDVEQKIKNQTALLELYKDEFDDKEKLRADAVNEYLRQQDNLVAVQKANEKELNSTKLNIIEKYGAGTTMSLTDSLDVLNQKKSNSAVYRKETQQDLAGGGTGGAGTIAGEVSPYQQERAFRTTQSVNELRRTAVANPGIFGRTAALPIPGFLRSDAFRNFSSELNTLKSSIAFGELTAMREASKTGGALGQVSDREGKLLESALGALEMNQSPENFVKQLDKINASITRWQNAIAASASSGTLITAPNGDIVEITD